MKIERRLVEKFTIEEFAVEHDLTMEVVERSSSILKLPHMGEDSRFYAHFKGAEVMERGMLSSSSGNGATEEEAIRDYARQISERRLAFNATSEDNRVEIKVPSLKID